MVIPNIAHQTAISTLVANYYRIEVTASLGAFSSNNPSIYSPLFIMKKFFAIQSPKDKFQPNLKNYTVHKPVVFRAPEHFFKKNRNLSVMNFRTEDIMTENVSE